MDEAALQDRRRKNLRAWITARGGIREAFKGRAGVPASYESYLSQVLGGHSFGSRGARTCEGRLGMPSLWLDADHETGGADESTAPQAPQAPAPDSLAQALEVIGIALAAEMPDDVRQDVADLLAKLAHRKGAARHQEELLSLLQADSAKLRRAA